MDVKEVKKKLGLSNTDVAEIFGYKDANSYANSARKENIDNGIVTIYNKTIENIKKCLG